MTPPIGRIALTRYLAALIGSQVAFGTALNLIELAGLKTPSSLGIVGGLIGTMVAAHWFVSDHKRAMTTPEKQRFAIWGTVMSLALFPVAVIGILLATEGWTGTLNGLGEIAGELKKPVVAGIVAAVTVFGVGFSYVFYYWCVGYYTNSYAKKVAASAVS